MATALEATVQVRVVLERTTTGVQAIEVPLGLMVTVAPARNPVPVVPYTPGLMLLTGLLSVGTQEEADGRISSVRLILDPPTTEQQHLLAELASSAKTNSTTTAPTSKPAP